MNARDIAKRAAAVVATLIALLILWQISVAVAIFFAALALGACMYPLVEHLQENGWRRGVAIILAVCGSLALVLGFALTMAVPLVAELQQLGHDLTLLAEEMTEKYPDHWLVTSFSTTTAESETQEQAAAAPPALGQTMRSVVGTATELMQLGAHIAICVALSVYWTIDRQRIERLWLSLVPVKRRSAAQKTWQSVERELGAYLRSELAQGLLATMVLWAGFELLGLRYAALAALVAAVLQMLPWLGNLFAVGAVMAISSGKLLDLANPWFPLSTWAAVGFLILVLLALQFIIEPRLFNPERYNSLWIVLTTMALTVTFGIWGLLFGPAVGCGIQIVLRQIHPLFFYEPARQTSLDTISERLVALRLRYPPEDTPPEILSFLDRLESIVESRSVATAS